MSNYSTLKGHIDNAIYQNDTQDISGTDMNSILKEIVDSFGAGYLYMGVATPSTNPSTPDQNVFYIAGTEGTYTNFGGITVANEVAVLKYNGAWSKQNTGIKFVSVSQNTSTGHTDINIGDTTTPVASVEEVSQLGQKVNYYNVDSPIESSYITGYIANDGQLNKIGDEVSYGLRYISVTSGDVYYIEATSVNNFYSFIAFAPELQTGATCDIIAGKTDSGVTVKKFYKAESNGYLLVWAAFSSPTTEVGHFYSTTESNINDVVRKNVDDIAVLTDKTDKIQENNYRGNGISILDGSNDLDLDIANNFVFCYAKTERAINARIQIVYNDNSIHNRIAIYGEGASEIYVKDNSVGIIETDDIIFLYDWSKHTSNYNEWYATSHLSLSQNITESIYSKIKSNSQLVDKCVEKLTKVVERTLESTTFDQAYVKDNKTIASYSGSYILYYPVTKGVEYTINLNNWGVFASYPSVCFSANTPVIGQEVDAKIYQASSDTHINLVFDWTAVADGYLYLSHWSGTAKVTCLLDYIAKPVLYKDAVISVQVFGDSISDNTWGDYRTWVDIAIQYIKSSSVKIINSAIGGTHLCSNSTTAGANESGVWKVIENGLNKYSVGIGRSTSALKLQNDTTIAIIFAGTNDFNDNYALGDITDSGEGVPLTICSAVHRILTYISTNYPNCKVIWVTPMQRYNITDRSRSKDSLGRTLNTAGWTLQEAGDKIAEICALYSVPCIKMYDVLGINEDNIDTYTTDGLHPNIKGDEVIATAICDMINQIIVDSPVLGKDKKPVTVTISGGAADYSDILQITPDGGVTETSMVNYDSEGRLDTYLIDLIPGKENAVVVKKNDGTKYSIDSITGTGVTYSNGKLLITSETTAMTITVSE